MAIFRWCSSSNFLRICLAAVILRILWSFLVPVIPVSDSAAYDTFAQNIWLHGTYGWQADEPTSYWPVGTSAIYSVFYMLVGHEYWPIIIFNIVCTLVIMVFSRLLCEQLFERKEIGLWVALVIALWPTLIFYTTILASELPYMAFLTAAFYFLINVNHNVVRVGIISGILFSVSYYIRPLATIPLVIGIFYLWLNVDSKRIVILRSLIVVVVLALAISPWAYRNYQLYNAFVPMSTNGGATLWMGNQPNTNGGYMPLPDKVKGMGEYTRNQVLKQDAIDYIKQEPVEFVVRTASKFLAFHLKETIGVTWNEKGIKQRLGEFFITPLKILSQLYWSAILLVSLAGILLFIKNNGFWRTAFHPFILLWASTAVIHSLIVAQDRYHVPIIPLVAAFAAYFLCCVQSKIKITSSRF